MKIYRPTRQLLEEVDRALDAKALSPGASSPLERIAATLQEGRHYRAVALYILAGDRLFLQASAGRSGMAPSVRMGEGLVGAGAQTGRAQLVTDAKRGASELVQPILTAGSARGVLHVESADQKTISFQDRIFLKKVASKLAIFLFMRGKYLVRRVRAKEASSGVRIQPQMSSGGEVAQGAAAGRRTAK